MALATITTKGQITIPKAVRDSLRLHTGDKMEFVLTNNREVLLRPISKKVDDIFGKLHKPNRKAISTREMDAVIRQKMKDSFQ
ncbi:MAG: AbrB/MazE/SpoVT family DNA-binding domain-containing protein [Deltaproteobacteria bacterium]|nr:AbrB/MazE/SpoVT family DNA-binding domain-containing protein [Deltaproteobacteria bacterium]MBW2144935.1 AbrB/MazE/SpoVT family DNA-binding domain-containing protein [Deltaproteobacteria bacterium]